MLLELAMGVAGNATYEITKKSLGAAFRYVANKRPDLDRDATAAIDSGDASRIAEVFQNAIGVIVADAASGELQIDGAALNALNGIKFNHQHGRVNIVNATISANVLVTGGSAGATGQTNVGGNTVLKSAGASIEIGPGASIIMTGGASIEQN